jgi:hypothetical protein
MTLARRLNDFLVGLINAERRVDPYFRPTFDRLFQRRLVDAVQALKVRRHTRAGWAASGIGQETLLDNEAEITAAITATMAAFLHATYDRHPPMLRGGNTKTYGVVRGELVVSSDVPASLRHGLFAAPATYPAWARFAGPGPLAPADLKDNGIVSIGVKVMGVDGPKLLDDEQRTQDFAGISASTFTTPNIVENLELQRQIRNGTPIFYFLSPRRPHLLDALMQALYAKAQRNPLYERYWSCSSYALGPSQAMHYSFRPVQYRHTPFPHRPGPDYLREAMVATLAERDVVFDLAVQLQTDGRRMPIEDDGIEWPERLSPFVPVAQLRLPRQRFDSPAQLAFADNLAVNPWHALEAHRPLGNQNRARRHIYVELSRLRQQVNGSVHIEPTGAERFDLEEAAR